MTLLPRWNVRFRVTWTLVSIIVVECLVFGLAMLLGASFGRAAEALGLLLEKGRNAAVITEAPRAT